MKKILLIVGAIFFLSSCCGLHTEAFYKYQNITIQRVDECGKSTFYYKNEKGEDFGKIWCEYSGFVSGFKGYLKFDSLNTVTILSGDGYFESLGLDTNHFQFKRISYESVKVGKTTCHIYSAINIEKEDNTEEGSGIKVKYIIDDNEWW